MKITKEMKERHQAELAKMPEEYSSDLEWISKESLANARVVIRPNEEVKNSGYRIARRNCVNQFDNKVEIVEDS